jgi:hypothetical protein
MCLTRLGMWVFERPANTLPGWWGLVCGGGGLEELRFASSRPAFPHLTLSHPFGV